MSDNVSLKLRAPDTNVKIEPHDGACKAAEWWREGVIYHVYLRSFCDSDGDGIGDLPGLTSRLEYLRWLGVDAIWISPFYPSPMEDFGYDVSDYTSVDPTYGTLEDFDCLIAKARRLGLRILLDIVPNHTSDRHSWFRDPRKKRERYIWADEPNNWMSSFHIPTWTYDPEVGRYYLHNYLPQQPDLDWWNEEVRDEFDQILRFWFDRGVDGFRIDACYMIVKDRHLRDNPPAQPDDHPWDLNRGQRPIHNAHRPEVHDVLRRWRHIAEEYDPPRLLTGATWVPDPVELATYYGAGDELHLAQNYVFVCSELKCDRLRDVVEAWLDVLGPDDIPVWLGSNHDHLGRFSTRWCEGDERKIRVALTMLLTLPGACILYQGDEIGMQDVVVPPDRLRDSTPFTRDVARTPMHWTGQRNGSFTAGEPWLPVGDVAACNVSAQCADPDSVLHLTRNLISLKKRLRGAYERLPAPKNHWRYRRGPVEVELDFERWAAKVSD